IVLFLVVGGWVGGERGEDETDKLAWQRPVALVMGLVLLGEGVYVFFLRTGAAMSTGVAGDETFGAPLKIGEALFTTYLLPFEITSVILLVALIGLVVLHQPRVSSKQ